MKIKKKYNLLLAGITVILISTYGYLFYTNDIKLEKINLSDERWLEQPGLIAVSYKENQQPAISFFRLSDGKEEKLLGDWKYNYFYQDEIGIFGTKPEKPTEQMFYLLNTRGGSVLNASKLPGPIVSISQNPKSSYLLISGVTTPTATSTQEYYTCVAEKRGNIFPCLEIRKDILKKEKLEPSSSFHAFWNRDADRQLAIKEIGGKNRLFVFDPWETTPVLVTSTEKIEAITDHPNPQIAKTVEEDSFTRFGDIAIFKNYKHPKGKLYVFINKKSPILLVSPRHFIFQRNDTFYILNTERQSITELAPAPKNIEKMSTLYSEYIAPTK